MTPPAALPVNKHIGEHQLRRKILERPLSLASKVLGNKLNAAAYLLIYMGGSLPSKF